MRTTTASGRAHTHSLHMYIYIYVYIYIYIYIYFNFSIYAHAWNVWLHLVYDCLSTFLPTESSRKLASGQSGCSSIPWWKRHLRDTLQRTVPTQRILSAIAGCSESTPGRSLALALSSRGRCSHERSFRPHPALSLERPLASCVRTGCMLKSQQACWCSWASHTTGPWPVAASN